MAHLPRKSATSYFPPKSGTILFHASSKSRASFGPRFHSVSWSFTASIKCFISASWNSVFRVESSDDASPSIFSKKERKNLNCSMGQNKATKMGPTRGVVLNFKFGLCHAGRWHLINRRVRQPIHNAQLFGFTISTVSNIFGEFMHSDTKWGEMTTSFTGWIQQKVKLRLQRPKCYGFGVLFHFDAK